MRFNAETTIARTFVKEWDQHIGLDGTKAILKALDDAGFVIAPKEPTEAMIKAGAGTEGARWIDSCISMAVVRSIKRPPKTFDKSPLAEAYRAMVKTEFG